MTSAAIIAANEQRAAALHRPYNPIIGIGATGERVPVWLDEARELQVYIPASMTADSAVVRECVAEDRSLESKVFVHEFDEAVVEFNRLRIRHDYEFWLATCCLVENQEDQQIIPFVARRPQRLSLAHREAMRLRGEPIRQIELKHRQYGSTTEKAHYAVWLQNVVTKGRHIWMISLVKGGAGEMNRRVGLSINNGNTLAWPTSITLRGVRNAPNTQQVAENNALIGVASAERPQGPSGYTAHIVLISEAGKMGSGDVKSAEALMTNVMSMVPAQPLTCVMVESTAEKAGRWFKRTWDRSQRGEGFKGHFTSWLSQANLSMDPQALGYDTPLAFVETWDAYSRTLWERGASVGQVAWATWKRGEYDELWQFKQEFPSSPEEAFQFGEKRVFPAHLVTTVKSSCRQPLARGRLVGEADTGRDAMKNLRFEKTATGPLRLYRYPQDTYGGIIEPGQHVANRCLAASDVGGVWDGADWNTIGILDRLPRLRGGAPEIVADYIDHEDPIRFAWICAQICTWYHNALWIPESNKPETEAASNPSGNELAPDATWTVLDEVAQVYHNVYLRETADARRDRRTRIGFQTNRKTKDLLISAYRRWLLAIHEGDMAGGYVERNEMALHEADAFLYQKPRGDGTYSSGAAAGMHDDILINRMLLAFVDQRTPAAVAVAPEQRTYATTGYATL